MAYFDQRLSAAGQNIQQGSQRPIFTNLCINYEPMISKIVKRNLYIFLGLPVTLPSCVFLCETLKANISCWEMRKNEWFDEDWRRHTKAKKTYNWNCLSLSLSLSLTHTHTHTQFSNKLAFYLRTCLWSFFLFLSFSSLTLVILMRTNVPSNCQKLLGRGEGTPFSFHKSFLVNVDKIQIISVRSL